MRSDAKNLILPLLFLPNYFILTDSCDEIHSLSFRQNPDRLLKRFSFVDPILVISESGGALLFSNADVAWHFSVVLLFRVLWHQTRALDFICLAVDVIDDFLSGHSWSSINHLKIFILDSRIFYYFLKIENLHQEHF